MTLVVHQSRYLQYNSGAFVSEGEACLVDPGILREETEALLEAVVSRGDGGRLHAPSAPALQR